MPRFSVVIPCYNRGHYLEEALESALSQEGPFELEEIILVDDHSDDPATLDLLARIGGRKRVQVISNPGRRGPAAARNVGIRAARGDWVAFLDSDDIWLPGALASQARVAAAEPECRWLGGDMHRWYPDGRRDDRGSRMTSAIVGPLLSRDAPEGYVRLPRPVEASLQANLTWTSTTTVRRELLLELRGYDDSLRKSEDGHLWIRLAARTDLWFVPRVLALYRQHDENITAPADPLDEGTMRAFRMLLADPEFRPYRRAIRRRLARLWLRRGRYFRRQRQFGRAAVAYARSLGRRPFEGEAWRGLGSSMLRRK